MRRRELLTALVTAPVVLASTALVRPVTDGVLAPVIEFLSPVQDVPLQGMPTQLRRGRRLPDPPLSVLAEQLEGIVTRWDTEYPGVRALMLDRLIAHQSQGLTLTELVRVAEQRWPWRTGEVFTDWEHHAVALSEVGHA